MRPSAGLVITHIFTDRSGNLVRPAAGCRRTRSRALGLHKGSQTICSRHEPGSVRQGCTRCGAKGWRCEATAYPGEIQRLFSPTPTWVVSKMLVEPTLGFGRLQIPIYQGIPPERETLGSTSCARFGAPGLNSNITNHSNSGPLPRCG